MLGCEGEAETAWQRPYMGEIAHYKVALFYRGGSWPGVGSLLLRGPGVVW